MVSRPERMTHRRPIERRTSSASQSRSGHWQARRGFSLVEMISTMILLGVIFTVSISILAAVARQRRGTEQRQFALQHASNLLERTVTQGWSELPTSGPVPTDPASADIRAVLPELEQTVDVTESKQDFDSKRVTVSVRWKNSAGRLPTSIRLSAWVYPTEGQSP